MGLKKMIFDGEKLTFSEIRMFAQYSLTYPIYMQRWAQITLYQKRNATKRNDLFNQQKRSAKCAI